MKYRALNLGTIIGIGTPSSDMNPFTIFLEGYQDVQNGYIGTSRDNKDNKPKLWAPLAAAWYSTYSDSLPVAKGNYVALAMIGLLAASMIPVLGIELSIGLLAKTALIAYIAPMITYTAGATAGLISYHLNT